MGRARYLITGAAGFIGANLSRYLGETGAEVISVVSPSSNLWRLKEAKTTIIKVDLREPSSVRKLLKKIKPRHLVHLATHGVYSYEQQQEERILVGNYQMTANLLSAAKEVNLKSFINIGTVFEYGNKLGKVRETDVDINDILNKYSASKMATTALAMSYKAELPIVTLRPFTTFGPFEDRSRFIAATILKCLKGEDISFAPGVFRDYVYIKDVVRAIEAACYSLKARGEIINVGNGNKIYLKDASQLIKSLASSESKLISDRSFVRKKESRCWANINKAKEILGWAPKYSFKKALLETILWYRENEYQLPLLPTP